MKHTVFWDEISLKVLWITSISHWINPPTWAARLNSLKSHAKGLRVDTEQHFWPRPKRWDSSFGIPIKPLIAPAGKPKSKQSKIFVILTPLLLMDRLCYLLARFNVSNLGERVKKSKIRPWWSSGIISSQCAHGLRSGTLKASIF